MQAHVLSSNAVSRAKAKWLHGMSVIVLIARVIQVTLWDKLLRFGEIGGGIASGQVTD